MNDLRPRELAGVAAVGVAVCCGLPLLLGAGALGVAAGIVLGSMLVAGAGVVIGALGWLRWRRRRACQTVDNGSPATRGGR